ncbi:MAG: sugar transferase [Acidobacteriota bacterium]
MTEWAPGRGLPRWAEAPIAGLTLVALTPILTLIAVAIRATSPGPALFRQQRVGRGGRPFTLVKFRTMRTDSGGPQVTAAGDPRITPIGRILRRTKLDELPELWNVLVGDMAFVGPRPEVPEAVDLDAEPWRRVLSARPGVTDPVTLRLRNEEALIATVPETDRTAFYRDMLQPWKLRGYVDYLERRTPWSDVGVLVATIGAIVVPSSAMAPSMDDLRAADESTGR